MKQDLRYTHGDIFETFPFPIGVMEGNHSELAEIGKRYFKLRKQYMADNNKGLTKFYNDLHAPLLTSYAIKELRSVRVELNEKVLAAYRYDDIRPTYGFFKVSYLPEGKNLRFGISEPIREEILSRLALLNKEYHMAENIQGQKGVCSSAHSVQLIARNTQRIKVSKQQGLDFDDEPASHTSEVNSDTSTVILGNLRSQSGWHAKGDILAKTGITDGQWNAAINCLIASGEVERQGEGRGTRYRAVNREDSDER